MADGSAILDDEADFLIERRPARSPVKGSVAAGRNTTIGRAWRLPLFVAAPVAVAFGALVWWAETAGYVYTDDAYVEAGKVGVSTDVSGIVKSVEVADNQRVAAGQVLVRLDDTPFRIAVDHAAAQLASARNEVAAMKAQYGQSEDEIRLAEIGLNFAQRDYDRRSALFGSHVVAQDAMDQAQMALEQARQRLAAATQRRAQAVATLGGSAAASPDEHPRVLAAKAQLAAAERDLAHTVLRAPSAGIVTNVPNLQPGMYLQAATPAFTLVASEDVWIEANPKESQLTWVRPGQRVAVSVDTYPGVTWTGTVASLSPASSAEFSVLPAQNTSGNWVKVVQRIPLRVRVENQPGQPPLRAGMSAEIEIDTDHRPAILAEVAQLVNGAVGEARPRG